VNRPIIASLVVAAVATLGFVAGSIGTSEYRNAEFGFRVQLPEFGGKGSVPNRQLASFYAPSASGGFTPNMNIQVHDWDKGLEAYIELSDTQFDQAGFDVLEDKKLEIGGRSAIRWVYTGRMGGRELEFLALAVEGDKNVILFTCVAPSKDFKDHEPAFRKSLESLTFEKKKKGG